MLGVQEHLRSQEHQRCTALDNALNRAEADRDQRVRPLPSASFLSLRLRIMTMTSALKQKKRGIRSSGG
jgi:hypothetical protein